MLHIGCLSIIQDLQTSILRLNALRRCVVIPSGAALDIKKIIRKQRLIDHRFIWRMIILHSLVVLKADQTSGWNKKKCWFVNMCSSVIKVLHDCRLMLLTDELYEYFVKLLQLLYNINSKSVSPCRPSCFTDRNLFERQNVGQLCRPPPFVTFDLTTLPLTAPIRLLHLGDVTPHLPNDSSPAQWHRGSGVFAHSWTGSDFHSHHGWLGLKAAVTLVVVQWNPSSVKDKSQVFNATFIFILRELFFFLTIQVYFRSVDKERGPRSCFGRWMIKDLLTWLL